MEYNIGFGLFIRYQRASSKSLGARRLRDRRAPAPYARSSLAPRYFFHVYDDLFAHDEEGVELPNRAAARLNALIEIRDLMAAQVRHDFIVLSHWIELMDEQGDLVLTITFRDAVDIKE
jgi:hypothetical protein